MPLPTPPLQPYNNQFEIPSTHNITAQIDNSLGGGTVTFQFPGDRPKYYTILKLATRASVGYAAVDVATIVLPLPINLVDVHKVKYDEKPIVPWASLLQGLIPAGLYASGAGAVGTALGYAASQYALGTGLGALLGLAPNEYPTMLFDRPEFKRHELSFKLSPRNYDESNMIRGILWALNNAMAPGVAGPLFTFPNIVQVVYKPNDGWLYKFKPAVIESMAINYAGGDGNKAFYHDQAGGGGSGNNPPESVEFTLHLIEIEYWLHGEFTTNNTQGTGSMTGTYPGLPAQQVKNILEAAGQARPVNTGGG